MAVLCCLWFAVRCGRFKTCLVSVRGACLGLFLFSGPQWWFEIVFCFGAGWLFWVVYGFQSVVVVQTFLKFRAVWQSGVVSLFRSAMVVGFFVSVRDGCLELLMFLVRGCRLNAFLYRCAVAVFGLFMVVGTVVWFLVDIWLGFSWLLLVSG